MKSRIVVGVFVLLGTLAVCTSAASGNSTVQNERWVLVNFDQPTLVGNTILLGPYLIVHDDGEMHNGHPCTSIYAFDPKKGPQEKVMTFVCIPHQYTTANKLVLTVASVSASIKELKEFQFAGDTEVHGVPPSF